MLLRINVHISFNGLQNSAFKGRSFPYVALCPSKRKKSEFRDISDVYDECIRLYEEAEKKGISISDPDARKHVYGMPYSEWKEKYQK